MSHYFIEDKTLKNEYKNIEYTYSGNILKMVTNAGVFSRDRVDYGTNVLLNNIEINGNNILDVGCGYGIIGLAIAKANPDKFVTMIDVNPKAVQLTKTNAENNKILNTTILESNLYENVNSTYDMIISNPPIRAGKQIVMSIVEEGKKFLNNNGSIWVVIQKKQGAESLAKKMQEVYGNYDVVDKINGYWIIRSIK